MAKYFQDIEEGKTFISPGRTITEADMVFFSSLTGDWNPIHSDEHYCRNHPIFSTRVVQGLLILSIVEGLKSRIFYFEDAQYLASLGWDWKFRLPVYPGDTIHLEVCIADKKMTKSGKRGIVFEKICVKNDRDQIVQEGTHSVLIAVRMAEK